MLGRTRLLGTDNKQVLLGTSEILLQLHQLVAMDVLFAEKQQRITGNANILIRPADQNGHDSYQNQTVAAAVIRDALSFEHSPQYP